MWLPKVGTGERVMCCCYCQITIVRGTPDASLYRENERLLSRGVCSLVVRCRNNKVSGCGLVQKTKAPRSLRTAGAWKVKEEDFLWEVTFQRTRWGKDWAVQMSRVQRRGGRKQTVESDQAGISHRGVQRENQAAEEVRSRRT